MELIKVKNLDKAFEYDTKVLENFSYTFLDKGFYLLFGESGCGKTTLLNLICGLEKPDKGEVIFCGEGDISSDISYITQDTYYVDYLTVFDNLKMAAVDMTDEEIKELAEKFGMTDRLDSYPEILSGGEKQRLAIVRAVVQKRGILILDEPTAALDRENTGILLKMLGELKKDILIIAASHDDAFKEYADYIIDFNNIEQDNSQWDDKEDIIIRNEKDDSINSDNENCNNENNDNKNSDNENKHSVKKDNKSLFKTIKYMHKEGRYKKREKKSFIYLVAFFVVALLVSNFFYDIANKFDRALMERYKVNRCLVYVDKSRVDELQNYDGVVKVDYVQGVNSPYYVKNDDENHNEDEDYIDTTGWFAWGESLPGDIELFPYADEIEYGTYFTKENQIILGYEYASDWLAGDFEDMIGRKIKLNPLDGEKEYEVVGILGPLSKDAENYFLQSCVRNPNNSYYFNGDDLDNLKYHEWAEMQCVAMGGVRYFGRIAVYVYFDDVVKLKEFYNQDTDDTSFYTVAKIKETIVDNLTVYTNLERFANPVKYVIIGFAVLFFFQTKLMEMNYHSSILAVYNYNGYKKWQIRIGYMIMQMKKIIMCILIGSLLSVVLSHIINAIDSVVQICPFILFEVDVDSIILLSSIMAGAAIIMSFITGLALNVTGWFTLLKKNRDLL